MSLFPSGLGIEEQVVADWTRFSDAADRLTRGSSPIVTDADRRLHEVAATTQADTTE